MRRLGLLAALALLVATPAAAQDPGGPNYREEWRQIVVELAAYAKKRNPNFVVLMRGAPELLVKGNWEWQWEDARDPDGKTIDQRLPVGAAFRDFIKPLDGLVLDGLYCGPYHFDKPLGEAIAERKKLDAQLADEHKRGIQRLPVAIPNGPFSIDPQEELKRAAEIKRKAEVAERQRREIYAIEAMRGFGRAVLSIEDCDSAANAEAAFAHGVRDGIKSFAAADDPRLDKLPPGHAPAENAQPVTSVTSLHNWLPMVDGQRAGTRAQWVSQLAETNFDMVVMDVAHRSEPLTKADVAAIHFKNMGPPRLVLADLPVGRAYDTRWYWQKGWAVGQPTYVIAPDQDRPGAYFTDLGNAQWKELLGKYIAGIMDLGFDGVMLDDLDTFRWFEDRAAAQD